MKRFEYMRLKLSDMPEDVIEHYKLRKISTPDGFIYCEIQKGMYGLPQAGIIAQELLEERLAKHGYHQSKITPGLWTHETRPISFSLVVDDFGVKYVGEEHAQHLLSVVRQYYKCSCDWDGERCCGLTLKWDYEGQKVHLTMPNYVSKALTRFQHPPPQTAGPTIPPRQTKLRGEGAIRETRRRFPPPRQGRKEIYTRGLWGVPFPSTRRRRRPSPRAQCTRIPTSQPDGKDDGAMQTIPGLHGNSARRDTHLQSQRHGACNLQRRLLSLGTERTQSRRRPHVHGHRRRNSQEQRRRPQHFTNNTRRHVFRRRSRVGSPIYQCENSCIHATHTRGTRSSPTTNADANRQLNRARTTHQQNSPQGAQSHGHEIPLATRPRCPRTISFLLAPGNTKSGGLLHQTPSSQPPQILPKPDPNVTFQSRICQTSDPQSNKYQVLRQQTAGHPPFPGGKQPCNLCSSMCLKRLQQGCVKPPERGFSNWREEITSRQILAFSLLVTMRHILIYDEKGKRNTVTT